MKGVVLVLCLVFYIVGCQEIKIRTFSTENNGKLTYNNYLPLETDYLEFSVKSERGAFLLLAAQYSLNGPYYEIGLGTEHNKKTFIRKNQNANLKEYEGPIFNGNYQTLYVHTNATEESVCVGMAGKAPFLKVYDADYTRMSVVGVASWWGSEANWEFGLEKLRYYKKCWNSYNVPQH